jgi:hypothetical protein
MHNSNISSSIIDNKYFMARRRTALALKQYRSDSTGTDMLQGGSPDDFRLDLYFPIAALDQHYQ